ALLLSGEARGERARTTETPRQRSESGRASAGARCLGRCVLDAAGATGCALVRAAAQARRGRRIANRSRALRGRSGGGVLPGVREDVQQQGLGRPPVVPGDATSGYAGRPYRL